MTLHGHLCLVVAFVALPPPMAKTVILLVATYASEKLHPNTDSKPESVEQKGVVELPAKLRDS